jgi:hypothetical protein
MTRGKNTVLRTLLTVALVVFLLGGCKKEESESDSAAQSVTEPNQTTQSDTQ